jgi:hypothetical protein
MPQHVWPENLEQLAACGLSRFLQWGLGGMYPRTFHQGLQSTIFTESIIFLSHYTHTANMF